jgi:hypothetical protein
MTLYAGDLLLIPVTRSRRMRPGWGDSTHVRAHRCATAVKGQHPPGPRDQPRRPPAQAPSADRWVRASQSLPADARAGGGLAAPPRICLNACRPTVWSWPTGPTTPTRSDVKSRAGSAGPCRPIALHQSGTMPHYQSKREHSTRRPASRVRWAGRRRPAGPAQAERLPSQAVLNSAHECSISEPHQRRPETPSRTTPPR